MKCPWLITITETKKYKDSGDEYTITGQSFGSCVENDCPFYQSNMCMRIMECIQDVKGVTEFKK